MTIEFARPILANHPAIRECLAAHGFQPTGASQFSNGRARVLFEGTRLVAIPAHGSRTWRSDVGGVPPEAVVALLTGFLPTPPFLSQHEIDRRLERTQSAKIALDRIVEVIRECPEAPSSRALRGFLWSLFNGHHLLNLWSLKDSLDRSRGAWVTEVLTAWMQGHVSDEMLRRALTDCGEMR